MSEAGQFAFFIATGAALLGFLLGPVGQALAQRLSGKPSRRDGSGLTTGEMAAERLAGLEARLAELEAVGAHVAEIEERLDFAERMLTEGSKSALPGDRR